MLRVYKKYFIISLAGIFALILLCGLVYTLPPVHDRLAWRVDNMRVSLRRFINPPEQVVFVPQAQVDVIVNATLTAMASTPTPLPLLTETPVPIPSTIPTAIPGQAALIGIRHEYQQFNNCAPASLSMVLSYWGCQGSQYETRVYLRPAFVFDDKK